MKTTYVYILSLGIALLATGCNKEMQFSSLSKEGTFALDPITPGTDYQDDDQQQNDDDQTSNDDQQNPGDDQTPGDGNGGGGNDYIPPIFVTDTFTQSAGYNNKLDLLVVLDNSDSMFMDYTYGDVKKKMSGLLNSLNGIDYHVAFTSTDVDPNHSGKAGFSGRLHQVIKPNMGNRDQVFEQMVSGQDNLDCRLKMGPNCGSNEEQPLKAAVMAIEQRNGNNRGFLRDDADLAILFVGDEEENVLPGQHKMLAHEAEQIMRSNLGSQKNIRMYGAIIKPGDSACYNSQAKQEIFGSGASYGHNVAAAVSNTGGRMVSFCDSNFVASGLSEIARQVSSPASTQTQFVISADPVEGSVIVNMTPESDIRYTVSGRTVTFERAPNPGTVIKMTFEKQPE